MLEERDAVVCNLRDFALEGIKLWNKQVEAYISIEKVGGVSLMNWLITKFELELVVEEEELK